MLQVMEQFKPVDYLRLSTLLLYSKTFIWDFASRRVQTKKVICEVFLSAVTYAHI